MPDLPAFDVSPHRLSGTVYGALLNDPSAGAALGEAVHRPPYKAPPKGPVLCVKPRNTLAKNGDPLRLPAQYDALAIGASLGMVIGRTACRVDAADARRFIAGYTIVNDVSVAHDSCYRPAIRHKARDGFCPIGPGVVPAAAVPDPDALAVRIYIDDDVAQIDAARGGECGRDEHQRDTRTCKTRIGHYGLFRSRRSPNLASPPPPESIDHCPHGQRGAPGVAVDHAGYL